MTEQNVIVEPKKRGRRPKNENVEMVQSDANVTKRHYTKKSYTIIVAAKKLNTSSNISSLKNLSVAQLDEIEENLQQFISAISAVRDEAKQKEIEQKQAAIEKLQQEIQKLQNSI